MSEKVFKTLGYVFSSVAAVDAFQAEIFRGKYFGEHINELFPYLFDGFPCNETYFASDTVLFLTGLYLLSKAKISRLERQVKD